MFSINLKKELLVLKLSDSRNHIVLTAVTFGIQALIVVLDEVIKYRVIVKDAYFVFKIEKCSSI